MSLLDKVKGWFGSEKVTVEISEDWGRVRSDKNHMFKLGQVLFDINNGQLPMPTPKPTHVDNYLKGYGNYDN